MSFFLRKQKSTVSREREAPYRFGLRWFSSYQGDTSTILYFRMLIFTSRSMSQVDRNVIDIRAGKTCTKNWYRGGASSERHFLSLAQSHFASSGLMVYCRQDASEERFKTRSLINSASFLILWETRICHACAQYLALIDVAVLEESSCPCNLYLSIFVRVWKCVVFV